MSNIDKTLDCLNIDNQKPPTNSPNKMIIQPALFEFKEFGKKLIKAFCEGIQFAIKLLEIIETRIKINENTVKTLLLNLAIISFGFVNNPLTDIEFFVRIINKSK